MNHRILVLAIALVALNIYAYAAQTSPAAMEKNEQTENKAVVSLYDQEVEDSHKNDCHRALQLFEQALRAEPDNPDVLNMLAHAQRKIGLIDEALANYKKAVGLRPRFREAHEYLGEACIQAALRE